MTSAENEYQRCARGLREAAEMARRNAKMSSNIGHAREAYLRAARYEKMAARELQIERMMRDLADDDHDITA